MRALKKALSKSLQLGGKEFEKALAEISGWAFDTFYKRYRLEGCVFDIPQDLTTRRVRGRFPVGMYEWRERNLMKKYMAEEACVLELGGCFGVLACLSNKRLKNPENHVVVEANPALIRPLERNRDQNACGFKAIHGLVSKNSDGVFYVRPGHVLGSGCYRPSKQAVTVPVYTVENLQDAHGVCFDTFMLDIEGGEYDFVMENKALLKAQAKMLLIEFHPNIIGQDKCDAIKETLAEIGMQCAENLNGVEVWRRDA